jgi:hypothetical protein
MWRPREARNEQEHTHRTEQLVWVTQGAAPECGSCRRWLASAYAALQLIVQAFCMPGRSSATVQARCQVRNISRSSIHAHNHS